MEYLLRGALTGAIATAVLDLWAMVAKHLLNLPTTNWAFVGRWIGHMRSGTFVHRAIASAAPVRGELGLGWATHYTIGIVYGIVYVHLARGLTGGFAELVTALAFSYALLVFPWFVMQPALGAGVWASRTPRPALTRLVNVSMHTAFGLGLYAGTRLLAIAYSRSMT